MRRRKKREYMEKGEVSEMLDILFHAFKIKKVPIVIKAVDRTYGGEKIQIGLRVRSTLLRMEDIVLHEFAHTLDWMNSGEKYRISSKTGKALHHDVLFCNALRKVTEVWYGDPSKYQWSGEYATVRKWYNQNQICDYKETV